MSEKIDQGFLLPAFSLIEAVDKAIQAEIDRDRTGVMQLVFNYYDTPAKPLDHREFIQFWGSLSEPELVEYYAFFF